jgi:hypothetical protein
MKKTPEYTPEISMRTEREETGVMDADVVKQLRLVSVPVEEMRKPGTPEMTEVVPEQMQRSLQRVTRDERDSDVVTSLPKKPSEPTPAGLPAGDIEELPQGGHMDRVRAPRRPEKTEHLNQSDIIAEIEIMPVESMREAESAPDDVQAGLEPKTKKARKRGPAPEATCLPGEGFLSKLEEDRQRRGLEGPPILKLDAPLVLERPDAVRRDVAKQRPAMSPVIKAAWVMCALVCGLMVLGFSFRWW